MKYLNKFNTKSDYEASASTLEIPNVAYITATTEVIYNATVKAYITFDDPVVGQKCATLYGDGTGCTEADLAAVSALSASDWQNTNITSFDELRYFTGLTSIPKGLFHGCSGLTSVIIPDSVTYIDAGAFINCSSLTSVTLGNSVSRLWLNAFYGCSALPDIIFPASVTRIDGTAFFNNSSLSSITFEATTPPATIASDAFTNLPTTGNITVPSGSEANYYDLARSIGANWTVNNQAPPAPKVYVQFADPLVASKCATLYGDGTGCTMEDLAAVTSIGGLYLNETNVTSFDEFAYFTGVTTVPSVEFNGCSDLASISFPSSLTIIDTYAFHNCISLTEIDLFSTSLSNIGANAFHGCTALERISFPASLTGIGNEAFRGCSSLSSIIFMSDTPPTTIGTNAFHGLPTTGNITVPDGSESNFYSLAQGLGANWTVNNQAPAPPALNYVLFEATATTAESQVSEITLDGVTISGNKYGNAGVAFNYTNGYRFQGGCSFEIIAAGGNITKIEFTQVSGSYPVTNLSPEDDTGTYTCADGVGTWVASDAVSTVLFIGNAAATRCSSIKVYIDESVGQ